MFKELKRTALLPEHSCPEGEWEQLSGQDRSVLAAPADLLFDALRQVPLPLLLPSLWQRFSKLQPW